MNYKLIFTTLILFFLISFTVSQAKTTEITCNTTNVTCTRSSATWQSLQNDGQGRDGNWTTYERWLTHYDPPEYYIMDLSNVTTIYNITGDNITTRAKWRYEVDSGDTQFQLYNWTSDNFDTIHNEVFSGSGGTLDIDVTENVSKGDYLASNNTIAWLFRPSSQVSWIRAYDFSVTYSYNCTSNWTSSNSTTCYNSTYYLTNITWTDSEICDESNYTFNISEYFPLEYNLTYSSNDCFNSTTNRTTYVYNDTLACNYSVVNYTYSPLDYAFSNLVNDCLNITRVRHTYWYNDTSGCGYQAYSQNYTGCFVAVCGDTNCSTSYKCDVGACVFDYNETQTNCCNDCGVPDYFWECVNNVLRERKSERTLTEIGQGTGSIFSGIGTPLLVFIVLLALGGAVGYILMAVGKGTGAKV